jgi:hypothetical protein
MAYTTIDNPFKYFNTVLYTGNGSTQSITGVGFQPDWVWLKERDTADEFHNLYDVIRGATKRLVSNTTGAESTQTGLTSFDSDGFSLGSADTANKNTANFVSWNWLASGSTASNSNGSITSSVSANTTAGFSIVSYTGTGSSATVGHGLGTTPAMVIVKNRSEAFAWNCYHQSLGATKYILLNATDASATGTTWNDTAPTSSVFSIGSTSGVNKNTNNLIAYCFAEKPGYSKFGSYTGNGNADGTFVYTGFKPAMVIIKRSDSAGDWFINDNKRDTFNVVNHYLRPHTSASETSGTALLDFTSNGFKIRISDGAYNGSGATYIYMAFAEAPFVTAGTKAAGTAR